MIVPDGEEMNVSGRWERAGRKGATSVENPSIPWFFEGDEILGFWTMSSAVEERRRFDAKRAEMSACGANLTILGGKRGVEKKRIPFGGLKL